MHKKILIVTCWYPTSANPAKGIFIKKHAEAIQKAGVEVVVIALNVIKGHTIIPEINYNIIIEDNIPTHYISIASKIYKFIHANPIYQNSILEKYFYNKIASNFKPDIIHSNVIYPAGLLGYWLSKKLEIPHIITEHWTKVDKFMSLNLFARLGKKAYNTATKVTVVSSFLKDNIAKYIYDREKIIIIPNVINKHIFFYTKKCITDDLIFTIIASWRFPKRPDLIFNALNEISKKTNQNIILNVIGEGTLLELLKEKEWRFKINFKGTLPSPEIAKVLQNSTFFAHASSSETFSVVIAEALATGTPVIASNIHAIPELINESNGVLVENDSPSWINGIEKIMNTKYNHEEIAKATVRFDGKKIGEQFKNLYDSVLYK